MVKKVISYYDLTEERKTFVDYAIDMLMGVLPIFLLGGGNILAVLPKSELERNRSKDFFSFLGITSVDVKNYISVSTKVYKHEEKICICFQDKNEPNLTIAICDVEDIFITNYKKVMRAMSKKVGHEPDLTLEESLIAIEEEKTGDVQYVFKIPNT